MPIVDFNNTNILPSLGTSHLILTCSTAVDTLVLAEFMDGQGRELGREGWDKSDGRSLTGSIKTKGNLYPSTRTWRGNFTVNRLQADLFDQLLAAQKAGQQIVLTDNWDGASSGVSVFVDVDDRYLTPIDSDWRLLQFVAREEI